MPAPSNPSFETTTTPGIPDGWTAVYTSTYEAIATFGVNGWEDFEDAWQASEYLFAFELADISAASFTTLLPASKFYEDLEELWLSNQEYQFNEVTPAETIAFKGEPVVFASTNTVTAIPDNDAGGVTLTLPIYTADHEFVRKVETYINVTHPVMAQLQITAKNPDTNGTAGNVWNNAAGVNLNTTVSLPDNLTNFGFSVNGEWTLKTADTVAGNTGTVNSWELRFYQDLKSYEHFASGWLNDEPVYYYKYNFLLEADPFLVFGTSEDFTSWAGTYYTAHEDSLLSVATFNAGGGNLPYDSFALVSLRRPVAFNPSTNQVIFSDTVDGLLNPVTAAGVLFEDNGSGFPPEIGFEVEYYITNLNSPAGTFKIVDQATQTLVTFSTFGGATMVPTPKLYWNTHVLGGCDGSSRLDRVDR